MQADCDRSLSLSRVLRHLAVTISEYTIPHPSLELSGQTGCRSVGLQVLTSRFTGSFPPIR